MRPSWAFRIHREALRALVTRHGVLHPRIFDSVLRGEDGDGSDLDLLVEPTSSATVFGIASLQLAAEQLLGVPEDVLAPKSLPRRTRDRVLQEAESV